MGITIVVCSAGGLAAKGLTGGLPPRVEIVVAPAGECCCSTREAFATAVYLVQSYEYGLK